MEKGQSAKDALWEVRLEKEKLALEQERKEFMEKGAIPIKSDNKTELEFSRYKQDCRKRALDLAHDELMASMNPGAKVTLIPGFNIIELADKYYQWLIKIPQ